MVYTIAIFMLVIVLVDFLIMQEWQAGKNNYYFIPKSDGENIAQRVDELKDIVARTLRANATLSHTATNATINISDSFPLTSSAYGRVLITPAANFAQTTWAQNHNCSVGMDTAPILSDAVVLSENGRLNYTQDNQNGEYDLVEVPIIYGAAVSAINVSIYCTNPRASENTYTWATTSNPAYATLGHIRYSDSGGASYEFRGNFARNTNQHFVANYSQSLPASFIVDWNAVSNKLVLKAYYSPKSSIDCKYNISVAINRQNTYDAALYIPINSTIRCQNATYSGYLYVARD